jgi:hypothetical protein
MSNVKIVTELECMWKEAVKSYFEIFWNILGRTEENQGKSQSG